MRNEACWKEIEKCLLSSDHPYLKEMKDRAENKNGTSDPVSWTREPSVAKIKSSTPGNVNFPVEAISLYSGMLCSP